MRREGCRAVAACVLLLLVGSATAGRVLDATKKTKAAKKAWQELVEHMEDASDFLDLVEGLGMFPAGLPSGSTFFLPDNASMQRMLQASGFKDPDEMFKLMPKIEDDVGPKLIAMVLFHIVNDGAWTDTQLSDRHTIKTALEGAPPLTVDLQTGLDGSGGAYALQDPAGSSARLTQAFEVGGSMAYVIDAVLMPEIGGLLHCPQAKLIDAIQAASKLPASLRGKPAEQAMVWAEGISANALRIRAAASKKGGKGRVSRQKFLKPASDVGAGAAAAGGSASGTTSSASSKGGSSRAAGLEAAQSQQAVAKQGATATTAADSQEVAAAATA